MNDKNDGLRSISFLAIAFLLLAFGFLLIRDMPRIADEDPHSQEILSILDGSNYFPDICPYLPGYHWTVAILCMLVHSSQLVTMRLFSIFFSFLTVASFFSLAKKIDPDSAIRKSFLFVLFPLFFPYTALIYTDMYSMMFLLLALFFALNGRLRLSGIVSILSLLVRQNNIVWVLFIALVAYFENCDPQRRWKDAGQWIPKFFFFFLAVALTVAFVIGNRGFVLGDRTHHVLSLTCGNLFFLLLLFFFLFLPHHVSNFPKIRDFLKAHKLMGLVLAEVFLVYFYFFRADHPFNSNTGTFLRNGLLWDMLKSPLNKCLYFLPIGYSVLSLCVTPLKRKSFYLLYPFTVLFLIPLPLIEVRYGFVPLALFLLFKEPDSERMTLFTLATYIVPIAIFFYYMKTFHVFI